MRSSKHLSRAPTTAAERTRADDPCFRELAGGCACLKGPAAGPLGSSSCSSAIVSLNGEVAMAVTYSCRG